MLDMELSSPASLSVFAIDEKHLFQVILFFSNCIVLFQFRGQHDMIGIKAVHTRYNPVREGCGKPARESQPKAIFFLIMAVINQVLVD